MLQSHPEISQLLGDMSEGVADVLGGGFTGLYIYGSLAAGDFNYKTSDIDFIGVSESALGETQLAGLNSMHLGLLADHPLWASRLEGSYFTREGLRRYDPDLLVHARWSFGTIRLELEEHGRDFDIHRRMLLDHGRSLAGPELRELIDPVPDAKIRRAIRELLATWWRPMLADQQRLEDLDYRCYAVQTMCRVLYTLKFGEIANKPDAARWAINNLDEHWQPLINGSFAWPRSTQEVGLQDTLALIRFVATTALPAK